MKTERLSGILLPLFSLRGRDDFGIGDFGCVDGLLKWMQSARQKLLMLLPLLPTAPNDSSPYSTRSAFGLNPLFIDTSRLCKTYGLSVEPSRLEAVRSSERIRYSDVFALKGDVFEQAFKAFSARGERAALVAFLRDEARWLEPYGLFCALAEENEQRPWWQWPAELAQREPKALDAAKERLAGRVEFHCWLQWVAQTQWAEVRAKARAANVLLCGDEPFIIGCDSADAWQFPQLLRREGRLGVPPDDFSADGQDWGLPWFDFAAMEREHYGWLSYRAKKAASCYDLRRVDHAIGYFRQYIRDDETPRGRFVPPDEPSQRALGERHFRLLSEGAGIVAEDLGVIPRFAREVLAKLELPGYKVMRWARENGVYENPRQYAPVSLVTTGTHDTETLRSWWETAPQWERDTVCRSFLELNQLSPYAAFGQVHEALLSAALNSSSQLCVLPWQDVLGEHDRINLPGTVGDANWTYRVRVSNEELATHSSTRGSAEWLAGLTERGER